MTADTAFAIGAGIIGYGGPVLHLLWRRVLDAAEVTAAFVVFFLTTLLITQLV